MITALDTQSWSQILVSGNAEFVETSSQTLYVVSNIRGNGFGTGFGQGFSFANSSFEILQSAPVPPAPGPGSVFNTVATYVFPQPNSTFDPSAIYDPTTGLIHILGTRNTPTGPTTSSPQLSDIVKFTFNTANGKLTGPFTISAATGSRIRSAYDIVMTGSNTLVAMSLTEPAIAQGSITSVLVISNVAVVSVATMLQPFVPGQWLVLTGLTEAGFLNGQLLQVIQATSTYFTAGFVGPNYGAQGFGGGFGFGFGVMGSVPDTGTALPVGNSLLVTELDSVTNAPEPGSTFILDSSPLRSGNTFDGVSLVSSGGNVELYYQSHPKLVTFQDQTYSINLITRKPASGFGFEFGFTFGLPQGYGYDFGVNFGGSFSGAVWGSATTLTTFLARMSDNRLTVFIDQNGNRYLSQTFYNQFNHPEGLVGNALLGSSLANAPWVFHETPGTIAGGSIVQGALASSKTRGVNFTYLLEPFEAVPPPAGLPAAFPFKVGSVSTGTMAFADVPGFYNNQKFTWLRGTKTTLDDNSLWAVVGEQEVVSSTIESQLIPAVSPYSLLVQNAGTYWQNVGVVDNSFSSPATFTPVINSPAKGQYVAQSNGEYVFNAADASVGIVGLDLTSNIITVTGTNVKNLVQGQTVLFSGLTQSTYLNNQTVAVTAINTSLGTFNANFVHPNDPEHPETGLAGKPLSITYAYISAITPTYMSLFNVPPVAAINPQNATVFRAQPLFVDASGSVDADGDAMQFTWTENDPDTADIVLTPNASSAVLNVSRAIGGNQQAHITNVSLTSNVATLTAANTFISGQIVQFKNLTSATFLNGQVLAVQTANPTQFTVGFVQANYSSTPDSGDAGVFRDFNVGVAVVDLFPDLVTPRHPAIPVTSIQSNGSTVTITANTSLAPGETVMLYGLVELAFGYNFGFNFGAASPLFAFNDLAYTVQTWTPTQFTATAASPVPAIPSTAVSGSLIPQFQYAILSVQVPFNAIPTISFPAAEWGAGPPSISVARNTAITLNVNPGGVVPYPVIVTGVNDADDSVSYLWEQTSGTTVLPGLVGQGHLFPFATTTNLIFQTNGVDIHGETLGFRLTVNDGVNPPVVATFSVTVASYNFVNFDTKKLSRSVWQETVPATNVSIPAFGSNFGFNFGISQNQLIITANNQFAVGQTVTFSGFTAASFLNGQTVTVSSLIGSGPTYTGFVASFLSAAYPSTADTGNALANARISQRNSAQTWSSLDQSAIYSNLGTVKRTSVLDGTDRYVVISPNSVLVYGGITPNLILLRRLLTPLQTSIVDAFHTENDVTYVLDSTGTLFRYSTAPLINTDNPDVTFLLNAITSMQFNKIFATFAHSNVRVLALSGPEGCLLVQVANDTLQVQGTLALTTASNLVVGSDNVQFVRTNSVETLSSGKILLGTVANVTASVTAVAVSNNAVTLTSLNNFKLGDAVLFSGFTGATNFLNGVLAAVINATPTTFEISLAHADLATTATAASSLATAANDGKTFETLIDLAHQQIIGTWDASKLRNQFVNTGEILFEPDSSYSGRPSPPVQSAPTVAIGGPSGPVVTISWAQTRPDLVAGYNVQYAVLNGVNIVVGPSLAFMVPTTFGADAGVTETVPATNIAILSNVLTVTAAQNYTPGTRVTLTGMSNAAFLNGQVVTAISSSGTQFTASFTHANYGPAADTGFATQTLILVQDSQLITEIAISSNFLTVVCSNNFVPGAQVELTGLTTAVFLNNQTVTVVNANPTSFTANFPFANYGPASDTGIATQQNPGPNQYSINASGLYTFNSVQLGRHVTVLYLSPFGLLKQVFSGATQAVTFPLASGSYSFQIVALGKDGTSPPSNAQSIAF